MSRELRALGIGYLLWGFAIGLYTTQWPVFLQYKLGSPDKVGLANALINASAVASYFFGAWIGNFFSKKPLFMLSWGGSAIAPILWAYGKSVAAIYVGCALFGFISSFASPLINSYFLDELGDEFMRGSMYTSSSYSIGMVIGPFIGGVVKDVGGYPMLMYATALCFLFSAIPLAFLKKDKPKKKSLSFPRETSYYKALIWAAIMSFAMMLTTPYAPLFAKEAYRLSGTMLGILGSISAVGAVLLTYLGVVMPNRARVIKISVWCAILGTLLLLGNEWLLWIGFFFRGAFMNTYSLITSGVSHRVPRDYSYIGFALLTATIAAANSLASAVGGYIYSASHVTLFVLSSILIYVGMHLYQFFAGRS
jgi:MFS family permease